MKCIYYLAPTLPSANRISDDLHAAGFDDLYLHVVTKGELGLEPPQIHSANCLETHDLIRDGSIGAAIGFLAGLAGIGLLDYVEPFGPNVPALVYVALLAAATLFGAWDGGLIGISSENTKLRRFRAEIESGRYLVLVYVRRHQESAVRVMMREAHPEAALVGIDRSCINPFSSVEPVAESPVSKTKVSHQEPV